ncbi:MAG: sigma-70 family RNA polymerase sigma factor [Deltaproteobacteria bacterium]|nr:MAG: sigma-70 family RNA polymerase sigma factor [Deltaproteobacteria bacterium]
MAGALALASVPAPISDAPNVVPVKSVVSAGHHERLRHIFDAELGFVWRFLRRLGLDQADADDGSQQVFMVVARALDNILPGKERAFLCGTAVRVASDVRRRKQRRREVALVEPRERAARTPQPDVLTDCRQGRALLDEVLGAMRADLRSVFVLYELEEMSTQEIGAALGVPRGTAASRLRKARAEFHAIIKRKRAKGEIPGGDR